MDFLKEAYEAWSQRVKTPLVGSMIIAFFAWNWKPIWYLFASDESAAIRLRFFELNTDAQSLFVGPAIAGGILALVIPWLAFVGAFLTAKPFTLLKNLQQTIITQQRVHRYQEDEREEEAKEKLRSRRADSALQKLEQAKQAEELGDEELAASIKAEDTEPTMTTEQLVSNLTDWDIQMLSELATRTDGRLKLYDSSRRDVSRVDDVQGYYLGNRREFLAATESLQRLAGLGLASKPDANSKVAITLLGYEVADQLK